jgi:TatD DNase family protein
MMFDTHCHLNFEAFSTQLEDILNKAHNVGVSHIVIPGTDLLSSQKAISIAEQYTNTYAAVGIHPHHVFEQFTRNSSNNSISDLEILINSPQVVAIGEVGLDRHIYKKTKYEDYHTSDEFVSLQKEILIHQIKLAIKYNKSLIIHNREATEDLLPLLSTYWDTELEGRTVLHCCEPREDILDFAIQQNIFLGVDGDITYDKNKQTFITKIPLELLVVETDSPFLTPEPYRSQKVRPNTPAFLPEIISCIAGFVNHSKEDIQKVTFNNACRLFQIGE